MFSSLPPYSQLKGESLNTLLHREGHKFNFQAVTKIMSQIAQVRKSWVYWCSLKVGNPRL